jgi:uncharacterized protein
VIPAPVLDWVEELHRVVDQLTAPVVQANGSRLHCRAGCHDCCADGLTVFEIEAAVIERHHRELLEDGTAHEPGGCAFLDAEGACRIYAHRPYVCRTQGLPLRWATDDGHEARDICPLNEEGPPLEELRPEACWTLGPIEERLAARQGDGARVPLRSLFVAERRRLPLIR